MSTGRAAILLAVAGILGTACSGSGPGSADPSASVGGDGVAVAGCEDIQRTFVGRERPLPGGHVQLDVFPIVDAGRSTVDAGECVTVRDDANGARLESAARVADTTRRQMAILVDPGRSESDRDGAVARVDALLDALGEAEAALYQWGPVDSPLATPAHHVDATSNWVVAADAGAVDANWRESRFDLADAFQSLAAGTTQWPAASDPSQPVLGRTSFDVFDMTAGSAELVVSHTHGITAWINGVEVLTSNLTDAGVADAGSGRRRARVTVPAELLQSGTNALAVEMQRTANGDAPELEATLTGSSSQVLPVAPIAPTDRASLLDRAVVAEMAPTAAEPGRVAEAVGLVVDDIENTHDDETDALRAVVVVAPGRSPEAFDLDGRADAVVVWVGAGAEPRDGTDIVIDDAAAPEDIAAAITARLDAVASGRLVLGICGIGSGVEAEVEVGVVNLTTTLRDPPPEDHEGECDPAAAAAAEPDPVDRVSLVLDEASRAIWSQRVADNDKAAFAAAVDLGTGWGPVDAEVKLRGQSSLECGRKSYDVNLAGGDRRFIDEEAAFDEFLLVSMCLDEGYVRTHTMLTVLADAGLFPPFFRLVHLDIDGASAGVYLLIEPPDEALRDRQPTLAGVVRRALDTSFQESSVTWSGLERDDVVFDAYENTIVAAEEAGADLLDRAGAQLDLDRYLRWLALMSLTENGDYADEVYFAGVGVADAGRLATFWTPVGWDPDDIFRPCHFDDFQFVDPSGLSSCAEARIDQALLSNAEGYRAYGDAVEQALESLTPADFDAGLTRTRARLAELVDDEAAAAMPELAALTALDTATAEGFLAAVDAEIEQLNTAFAARHAFLAELTGGVTSGDEPLRPPAGLEATVPKLVLADQRYPVRIAAMGSDGIDRRRNDEVIVRHGDENPHLLHHGLAVVTLSASGLGAGSLFLDGDEVAAPVVRDGPDRRAPDRIDDQQQWGPDEIVLVDRSLTIGPGGSLTIAPGTTIVAAPGSNIDVAGSLVATGNADAPVWFGDADPIDPWGGLAVQGGRLELDHVMITGGGGDAARAFGHSDSQPLIGAADEASVVVRDSVVADSTGKALGIARSSLDLSGTVVTRTDTGGELVDSVFSVADSWFLDFPTTEAPAADDDNDGLYLGPTSAPSTITDTVFIGGIDDGIDHAGGDVTLDRVWVEGFSHECVAASETGSLRIVDSVLRDCQHGLEAGYGSPTVDADHVLFLANGVAIRYGDDYVVPSAGSLTVSNSLLVDNVSGLAVDTLPSELALTGTVTDDEGDADDGLVVDAPTLDQQFLWPDGEAGLATGWPRSGGG